eukprot:TRINITY_DN2934_c0_g1_i1.p1 TRINITY_DN2934_c0_g1~~TRINITY_DN2934_c0_g1_i1.p1  ORF type:complete len:679 (+),score=152.62 TRINITY_DN2934_c0_g1_i1:218-2038(+)
MQPVSVAGAASPAPSGELTLLRREAEQLRRALQTATVDWEETLEMKNDEIVGLRAQIAELRSNIQPNEALEAELDSFKQLVASLERNLQESSATTASPHTMARSVSSPQQQPEQIILQLKHTISEQKVQLEALREKCSNFLSELSKAAADTAALRKHNDELRAQIVLLQRDKEQRERGGSGGADSSDDDSPLHRLRRSKRLGLSGHQVSGSFSGSFSGVLSGGVDSQVGEAELAQTQLLRLKSEIIKLESQKERLEESTTQLRDFRAKMTKDHLEKTVAMSRSLSALHTQLGEETKRRQQTEKLLLDALNEIKELRATTNPLPSESTNSRLRTLKERLEAEKSRRRKAEADVAELLKLMNKQQQNPQPAPNRPAISWSAVPTPQQTPSQTPALSHTARNPNTPPTTSMQLQASSSAQANSTGGSNGAATAAASSSVSISSDTPPEREHGTVARRKLASAVSLNTILSNPVSLEYFSQFLQSEYNTEYLSFWVAVETYHNLVSETVEMRAKHAQEIFSRYIAADSECEISIPTHVRLKIAAGIAEGDVSLFDVAQSTVFDTLNSDAFPRFLKSGIFTHMMDHLLRGSLVLRQRAAVSRAIIFDKKSP